MKKTLLLFFLLPIFGLAQTVDLASWALTSNGDITSKQTYVQSGSFTSAQNPISYGASGALVSGWNNPGYEHYRYFEVSIVPTATNVIWISNLVFQQASIPNGSTPGPSKYIAKYYISENGSVPGTFEFYNTASTLLTEESIAANPSKSIKINQSLNSNQTLIVRFYTYGNDYNDIKWRILANTLKFTGNLMAPLSGPYTIGSASNADFGTLTSAINTLNNVGVSAPVTFFLDNTTYNRSTNEVFPLNINSYFNNTVHKVTLRPNAGKSVTIESTNSPSSTSTPAVFKLNGVDKFIFDGINNPASSTTLTIYNNNPLNPKKSVIWIASENSSNGASSNEIKNLTLKQYYRDDDLSIGVFAGGTSSVGSTAEAANSSNIIQNVTFSTVGQAVYMAGNATNLSTGWKVQNNVIGGNADSNKPFLGIYLNNAKDYEISNNTISGVLKNTNASSPMHSGIIITGTSNGAIFGNSISDVYNKTDGDYCTAIYLDSNNNTVYNNFISNIRTDSNNNGNSNIQYKAHGIYINSGSSNKIYYNTIYMNANPVGGKSSCLYIAGGSSFDIRNNIFYNAQPNTGNTYYTIFSTLSSSAFSTLNNNEHYVTNTASRFNARLGNNEYPSLSDWQTATGKEAGSKNVLPTFTLTNATDLHLASNNVENEKLTAEVISTITTDIDGQTRVKPYMGADEIFVCVAPNITQHPTKPTATCSGSGTQTLTVTVTGSTPLTYVWKKDAVAVPSTSPYSGQGTSTLQLTNATTAESGSYTVEISNSCGTATSTPVTVDISNTTTNINSQAPTGQSTCINTAFSPISVTAVGNALSYQWYSTATSSNSTGTSLGNANGAQTNTYTPQSTVAGTLYYFCVVTGTCGTAKSAISGAFVTNTYPAAPSATVTAHSSCSSSTGIITITAPTGSGLTYSINGTDYFTSTVFNSVAPGSYTVRVKNSTGCVTPMPTPLQVNAITKTWTGATSTDWNVAGNWNPSGVPSSSDCVVIPAGVARSPIISDVNSTFYAYSLTVNDKASLVVKSFNTLKVTGGVTVLSSTTPTLSTGNLYFEDSSNLIQTDNTPNVGVITYNRIAPKIRQADYVYWSSPVKGQTLAALSPLTSPSKIAEYDGTKWVYISGSTVMVPGKGYIVRGPENYSNTERKDYPATFIGTPNNGDYEATGLAFDRYYLVGNPYPSSMSADQFILDNSSVITGTLSFWTHNTPVVLGATYRYASDDYALYNLTGGAGTAAAPSTGVSNPNDKNTLKPKGNIAAGQSFMIGTKLAGKVVFNNGMRSSALNNSEFYKPGKTSKTTAIEKNRVWLNMTNTEGAYKQLLVGYIEGATNEIESLYDGTTFDGNKYIDFYSVNAGTKLAIQGRALPFKDTDIVPLGYKSTIEGDFTISINEADGSLSTQAIYLEDKKTGVIHDLRTSDYTFTTAIGTFTDRLVLRYTNKTLGTGDFENIENGILVSVKDKVIKALSSREILKEVIVYDISGKQLYDKKKIDSNELQIANLQSSNQVLIVKIILENDFITTKKIIFQ